MDNKNSGRGLMKGFVLLCIGGILIAVGLSFGGQSVREFEFWPWNNEHFNFGRDCWDDDDAIIRPVKILEDTIPASVRNLVVDLKASSLDIRDGDVPGYRATDFREGTISIRIDGDTLTVEETDWRHRIQFGKHHLKSHLEIVLPEGVTLETSTISVGAGSMTMTDIDADTFNIESGAGSIKGDGIRAKRASLKTGAGSLEFTDSSFGETLIQTGAGRVRFDGELDSRSVISTGAGSVELDLAGSEDDYRVDFTRGIGSVRVGRSSYNGIGSGTAGNQDAERHLEITTGVGSVCIRFKE